MLDAAIGVGRPARRMTRLRSILFVGGLLLAGVVALVIVRTADRAPTGAPPPVDGSLAQVTFGSVAVRPGELLTFAVRNPTAAPFDYGVGAALDRWDGVRWRPAYQVGAALPGWHDEGQLTAPGRSLYLPAVGLTAPARGSGPQERLRLVGVPKGWYRLSITSTVAGSEAPGLPASAAAHDGPTAFGIFQVVPQR